MRKQISKFNIDPGDLGLSHLEINALKAQNQPLTIILLGDVSQNLNEQNEEY